MKFLKYLIAIPTFTVRPEDVKISYGQNIFIACEATGNPTPIIVWAKSGGPLQQQSVILPGGIQLYSVASSDQGTYTCTAANSVGTNSTSALITVTSKGEREREKNKFKNGETLARTAAIHPARYFACSKIMIFFPLQFLHISTRYSQAMTIMLILVMALLLVAMSALSQAQLSSGITMEP